MCVYQVSFLNASPLACYNDNAWCACLKQDSGLGSHTAPSHLPVTSTLVMQISPLVRQALQPLCYGVPTS